MTYIKGSKRLAIIQRWLQGIDDPDYDVLPTKKEGKYILKKRITQPTHSSEPDEKEDPNNEEQDTSDVNDCSRRIASQSYEQPTPPQTLSECAMHPQTLSECAMHPQPKPVNPKPIARKPKPTAQQHDDRLCRSQLTHEPAYDPTVNLEILETLKLLGDEIRTKRERKQQKQLINQVIDKRMRSHHVIPKSKTIEEEYYSEDEDDKRSLTHSLRDSSNRVFPSGIRECECEPLREQQHHEQQPIFKSRIRRCQA